MKKLVFLFPIIIILSILIVLNNKESSPEITANEFLENIQKEQ